MSNHAQAVHPVPASRSDFDPAFVLALFIIGGSYVVLILAMIAADVAYTTPEQLLDVLSRREILYAIKLSLISCSITAILSTWAAVPLGYVLSRYQFRGKRLIDALVDIPIVLPPLVVGLSLLILFQTLPARGFERWFFPVTYEIPAVILAQFAVSCAFAVRTMRVTFDQITPRQEQIALTLGCSRSQAFWLVVLPQAKRGILTAGTIAWARALGEFGPILVFAGTTRMRTEVLSTTVFLELSVGQLESAVAVSLVMVVAAAIVLVLVRGIGMDSPR